MDKRIKENLSRQDKAVALLLTLLQEEFSLLLERQAHSVTTVELSLQELMRQIARERLNLKALIQAVRPEAERLFEIIDLADEEGQSELRGLLDSLDKGEQACAMQAEKNRQLVLGLFDQSRQVLDYMHRQIQPKNQNGYSKRGRMDVRSSGPALVSGRL